MRYLLGFFLIFGSIACNKDPNTNQGYRENQEEQTAPADYSTGSDSKEKARTRR